MDNIDVRLLRAFMTLMSERSVSRAADRLGVGQPALSQSLGRLRTLFGDPLLLRARGGMVPTDRANELEISVRTILAEYDRMLEPPERFDAASSRRRFVLTVPEYAEHLLMPHVFSRLRAEAPGVRVEVRAPMPDRAAELLEIGEVDLRIAWLLTAPLALRSMQLFQDEVVCIASASHPEVQGTLTLAKFLALPHVQPLGTGKPTTARVLAEAVEREGHRLERSFLVQNFLTIPLIVSRTDMLATLPRKLALTFTAQHRLQLLELPLRLPKIRYASYWHERSQKDPGHRWLRGLVQEAARGVRG
jgi:DNA-binding transcriptional LysR family regulator